MSQVGGTRSKQHGAILLGLAGGMLVVAAGLTGGYYVLGTKSEARAATTPEPVGGIAGDRVVPASPGTVSEALRAYTTREVAIKTAGGIATLTWADLGIEVDPDELGRTPVKSDADLTGLAAKASIPV